MDGGTLELVGLAPESPEAADGLVALRHPPAALPVDEAAIVLAARAFKIARGAQQIDAIDYIFFRRFDDGRSSQPAAFVINNADEHFTQAELAGYTTNCGCTAWHR